MNCRRTATDHSRKILNYSPRRGNMRCTVQCAAQNDVLTALITLYCHIWEEMLEIKVVRCRALNYTETRITPLSVRSRRIDWRGGDFWYVPQDLKANNFTKNQLSIFLFFFNGYFPGLPMYFFLKEYTLKKLKKKKTWQFLSIKTLFVSRFQTFAKSF